MSAATVVVPAGYTLALTRIPTAATGVYLADGTLVRGKVTLNVKDGSLNSVTVKVNGTPRTRLLPAQVKGSALSFPTRTDALTYAALTR